MLSRNKSAKRLLALANKLDKVRPLDFNYALWTSGLAKKLTPSCGTTGCAGGWAASMPQFIKQGLHLVKLYKDDTKCEVALSRGRGVPRLFGFDALGEVFGLDSNEASFIFSGFNWYGDRQSPDFDAAPSEVATHIRQFVEDHRS